jgi:CRISPR-associated endonuclease/helicase Cas3
VVRNTVEKAVETFYELERRLEGRYRLLLIHGRLSTADRERAVQRMNDIMSEGGIIVSTQVIEAGVETNASILITDAAPVENLAQRAGRLCREGSRIFEKCRENGAQVYVIKPESGFKDRVDVYSAERVVKTLEGLKQFLEAGKAVDWRLLGTDEEEGRVSFTEILESAVPPPAATSFREKTYEEMLKSYLETDTSFEVFEKIQNLFGEEGFFRKTVQVRLAVPLNGGYDYVDVDFEWLVRKERELVKNKKPCLEYYPDGRAKVLGFDHVKGKFVEKPSEMISLKRLSKEDFPGKHFLDHPGDLYKVAQGNSEEVVRYFALLLRKECYEPGIGLVIKHEQRA